MVNIAQNCELPDVGAFITEMQSSTVDLALAPTPLIRPGINVAVGIGADAVATALSFIGLEAFILATALQGENLVELLLELQQDPQLQQDIQTQIRTDTMRCLAPALPRLGLGATDSVDIQETWNELGSEVDDATKETFGFGVSFTPAQVEAMRAWRRTLAQLANCLEILIERSILCRPQESKSRCRVPAIVEPCILRASPDKTEPTGG